MLIAFSLFGCKFSNSLDVELLDQIKENEITIDLFEPSLKQPQSIFKNGKKNRIPFLYGENDWIISYNDSLDVKFRHFKTNRNDKHKYFFRFYKKDETILVDINIQGVSNLRKTAELKRKN